MSEIIMNWILLLYMLLMFAVGFYYYKINKTVDGFLLGKRKMHKWTAAVSAGLSFICGLVILTLPSEMGNGNGFLRGLTTVVGVCLGMVLQWLLITRRLRVYTELSGNSRTLPKYLENRFDDKNGVLRTLSAAIILVFFTLLASTAISAASGAIASFFKTDYHAVLFVTALFTGIYLCLGGLPSSMGLDLLRLGYTSAVSLVVIGLAVYTSITGNVSYSATDLSVDVSSFTDTYDLFDVFPLVGFALASMLMPFTALRFSSVRTRRNNRRFAFQNLLFVIPTLLCIGIVGLLGTDSSAGEETGFLAQASGIFTGMQYILVVFLYIVVVMSLADAAILTASSAFSEDIYPRMINKSAGDKEICSVSRVTVFVVTVIAALFAVNSEGKDVISPTFAWSVIASAFGPSLLFPLYMKKATWISSFSSIVAGLMASVFFVYGSAADINIPGMPFAYLLPSVAVSTVVYFAVYVIAPKKPSNKVLDEFDRVNEIMKLR